MFEKYRKKLTKTFTALVISLILVNGIGIISFNYFFDTKEDKDKIIEESSYIIEELTKKTSINAILKFIKNYSNVILYDDNKNIIYKGKFFNRLEDLPNIKEGLEYVEVLELMEAGSEKDQNDLDEEIYRIYTQKINNKSFNGYIQVSKESELDPEEIWGLIEIFITQSFFIGILVYFLGIYFSKKSLKPAEDMLEKQIQFTHDASHQLKTPLAIINSSLDVALKKKEYEKNIIDAKDEVKNANGLINKLLELANADQDNITSEKFNLSKLVNNVIEKQSKITPKNLNIKTEKDIKEMVEINGDKVLVRQIIINLIENAIKFNIPNGYLKVKLNNNFLYIENSTERINDDFLETMFERFSRDEEHSQINGYGIGLSIVKKITHLHEWRIKAKKLSNNVIRIEIEF